MMINTLQKIVQNPDSLSDEEFDDYLNQIQANTLSKHEVVSFLTAFSARPPDSTSIVRFVRYIENNYPKKRLFCEDKLINIVGTGGGISTFNISTTAAILASSAGAKVLKSGSYSYNSKSGSLDIIKSLGISTTSKPEIIEYLLSKIGIAFISNDAYSPFLKRLAVSIQPIPFKYIGGFVNIAGPLLCPYETAGQVTGVSKIEYLEIMSHAMELLNRKNSIVVHAEMGMDEFSSIGKNHYIIIDEHGSKTTDSFNHTRFNFVDKNIDMLMGGSPDYNAEYTKKILSGEIKGAASETVLLNSASILLLAGKVDSFGEGVKILQDLINDGSAEKQFRKIVEVSKVVNQGVL
jgi:anthranilate phosphoribosyltransferase